MQCLCSDRLCENHEHQAVRHNVPVFQEVFLTIIHTLLSDQFLQRKAAVQQVQLLFQ